MLLQGAATDPAPVRQLREAIETREAVALEILNYFDDVSATRER